MIAPFIPPLNGLVACATLWLIVLKILVRVTGLKSTPRNNFALVTSSLAVVMMPVEGLPIWTWLFSYHPNPCVPMLGLLIAQHCPRFCGIRFFEQADWNATWRFGAIVGTIVFLHPVIWGGIDFYYWGWDSDHAAWLIAGTSIVFLALGNHFGVLLLGALVIFLFGGLESTNSWDYIIDPIFWLASLIAVVRRDLIPLLIRGIARIKLLRPPVLELETNPSSAGAMGASTTRDSPAPNRPPLSQ